MQGQQYRKRIGRSLLASALGMTVGCAIAAYPAVGGESTSGSSGQAAASAEKSPGQQGEAGMRVYIDPRTGAIVPTPVPGTVPLQVSPQTQQSMSTSDQGLVQTPSPVPGGGIGVNVQGRFQSPLIATVGPDGKTRMHHLGEPPASHDK